MKTLRKPGAALAAFAVVATVAVTTTLVPDPASAAHPDLTIEIITAPNYVVDSNIEAPSSYGPEAAHVAAKVCNTGTDTMTDVMVMSGDFDPDGNGDYSDSTPGIYPSRTHTGLTGTFSLTHQGGTGDAVRYIPTLAPGECTTQYYFVSYPTLDDNGDSVTGGNSPDDDLWLNLDMWVTATDPIDGAVFADDTTTVTMRSEISAMANKTWPNTTSKVPDEYLTAFEEQLGWRPDVDSSGAGQEVGIEGVWYDLGAVRKGYDADGDFVPDYDLWMQPVGDPLQYDPTCTRLVRTYGTLIVKLNDGTEMVIAFEDDLYFKDIPPNNTGVVGLVFYEFVTLDGGCSSTMTPYQEVASGADNEKFNGDYGAASGSFAPSEPEIDFDKNGQVSVGLGGTASFSMSATNSGDSSFGSLTYNAPLVFRDSIPDGVVYVAGSAAASNTLPAGTGVDILYSTDGGSNWTTTEPVASTVTDIAWYLTAPLGSGETATVTFDVEVPVTYTEPSVPNTAEVSVGGGEPFDEATHTVLVEGPHTLSGTTFDDDGGTSGLPEDVADGVLDPGEGGLGTVSLTLYVDVDGDGQVGPDDLVWGTTTSDASGNYSFTNLPDGDYLVEVDPTTAPTGYTSTSDTLLTPTIAGGDVTDQNFGFVEPLVIDKTGPTAAVEGELVTFDLNLTNQLPVTPTNGPPVYEQVEFTETLWATFVSTPITFPNPENANGAPDGVYSTDTGWSDYGYWGSFGPATNNTGTITKVEWVGILGTDVPATNDILSIGTWHPFSTTVWHDLTPAEFNPIIGGQIAELTYDVTADQDWSWTIVEASGEVYVALNKTGGADADMSIDALGLRVTSLIDVLVPTSGFDPDATLSPVPLVDTYDPALFEFVSASVTPTSVDEGTGTITWDDVGPLNSSLTETVQVTFRVVEAFDSTTSTSTHTNTMSVTGATFANGLPANDETDTADTTITGAGSVSGTIWNDADSDGWVGATGYEAGEQLLSGVTVTLFGCVDGNGDPIHPGTTSQDCATNGGTWDALATTTTDADGGYYFGALQPGYYLVEADPSTLPGSVTQSGDPDETGIICSVCDNSAGSTSSTLGTIPLEVATAEDHTDVNFGYSVPPATYGTLWEDVDGDGVQEEGEESLAGWTVELYVGGTLVATTTTDADGNYEFGDLTNGTAYEIVAVPPAGETWTSTWESDGTTDSSITLTGIAGVIDGSNDFAFQQTGSSTIGDQIYVDWDADGIQDANDEGVPGVTVELWRDDDGDGVGDVLVDTTTTDASGQYTFTDLPAGDYVVVVDPTASLIDGYFATADPDEPGIVCDTCDSTGHVTVDGTSAYADVDFGYDPQGTATIGDQIFIDTDGDGVYGPGDSTLADITVELWVDVDGDGTYVLIETTSSDGSGNYSFDGLPAGDYRIVIDDSDPDIPTDAYGLAYVATTPTTHDITLTDGQTVDTADGGFVNLGVIGDTIFADANANGTQDPAEGGIAGVTVELWEDTTGDGVGDTLVTSTVTDANGNYAFTGLQPGDYAVVVDESTIPYATVTQTADPDRDGVACDDNTYPTLPACDGQTVAYTIDYGTVFLGADLGYQPPGVIGDYVWLDGDGDGVQDPGEAGIGYVTVNLYEDTNGDGIGDVLIDTVITDGDGAYSFSGLSDGDYVVEVDTTTLPGGGTDHTASTGPESVGGDTAAVTISGGDIHSDIDFGYELTGSSSLAGTVCIEPDSGINGTCDDPTNETELEGIIVNLYDANGVYLGSTSTDANGDYTFVGLPDGDYTVSIGTGVFPLNLSDITDPSITETTSSVYQTVTVTGATTDVDFPFEQVVDVDLGDLDSPFDTTYGTGPYSEIGSIYLGATVDADTSTLSGDPANADATGDDLDGVDDEDGVAFNSSTWEPDALVDGDDGSVVVTVTGGDAYLVAWIDWNGDGALTGPDEMIINQAVTAGTATYSFDIPDGTDINADFAARFRLFEEAPALPSISYAGAYGVGEIEDYIISHPALEAAKTLTDGPTLLADGTTEYTYQVILTNTGAATLYDVSAADSLAAFGSYTATSPPPVGSYNLTGPTITSTTPSPLADPLTANTAYNGGTDTELLDLSAAGSLAAGETITIEFTVTAAHDFDDTCRTDCDYDNSVTASGDQEADGTADGGTGLPDDVGVTTTDGPVTTSLGSITGSVTEDTNTDDVGDDPVDGVTIELFADLDGDGNFTDLIATTTTDANGDYAFANVIPDEYRIVETQPAAMTSVSDSDGNNDDIIPVIVSAGTESANNDFVERLGGDPILTVAKSGPATAEVGDTVTYSFDVSHDATSDGAPVDNVTVVDDVAGTATYQSGDTDGDDLLDAGETWVYEATYTVVATDPNSLTNTVEVDGENLTGDPIPTADDSHTTNIEFAPILDIVKSGPATANVDDNVTYTFAVSHHATSDDSPVSSVSVTDDVAGTATYVDGDTDGDGELDATETWNYTVSYTIEATDPNSLTNTATATGTDNDGDTVPDATDTHTTDVEFAPVLTITKSGLATAAVGQSVTYSFDVTHHATSDGSPVSSVTISDDVAGTPTRTGGDDGDDLLEEGETWTYQATYIVGAADPDPLTNTVTVNGTDGDSEPITEATDSHDTNVDFAPVLEIVKSGPATANVGDTVAYTFAVAHHTSSDGSAVSSVSVSDDVAGTATYVDGDTDGDGLLEPGETWEYSVNYTVAATDPNTLTNTATVSGTDRDSDPVNAQDSHTTDVEFAPVLEIVKSGPATAEVGDVVTYTFDVTHHSTSDGSPITGVSLADNLVTGITYVSGDTDGDSRLDVGETWQYQASYTVTVNDPATVTNTVTADGNDLDGDALTQASDTHDLAVDFAPILTITKTGPASADVGDTVTYSFEVAHDATSDGSPAYNVTVVDDVAGAATYSDGDTNANNLLDATETWEFTVTYTVDAADTDTGDPSSITNTATADGDDRDGESIPDVTDSHTTTVIYNPVLTVVKSGPATADYGDTVTYSFSVSHDPTSDDTPVDNLAVSDDVAGAATYQSGDTDGDGLLDGDETWVFEATHTIDENDPDPLINTATATGDPVVGAEVSATDIHSTDINYSPVLTITKSGPATVDAGTAATYSFAVAHHATSDGSPIDNVTVTDDVAGTATYVSGDTDGDDLLDGGETWQFTASHTPTITSVDPVVNTATADGDDLSGGDLADVTDTHSTDVDFSPILEVVKSGPATANVGDTVTYSFDVTHHATSDGSAVSNVTIADDIAGTPTLTGGDDGDNLLESGETWTYEATYTVTATDPDPLTNTVTVNGEDRDAEPITEADDTHDTDIEFAPVLFATKTGPTDADVGDTVTYTIAVTHDAASDGSAVAGVTVDDSLTGTLTRDPEPAGGDPDGDNLLDAGETWTYTTTYTVQPGDPDPLVNTVTIDGTDRDGDPTTQVDANHSINVEYAPVLEVVKSGPASAVVGDEVTYNFALSHDATSDGSPMTVQSVNDDLVGAATYLNGDDNGNGKIDAGETWNYTATRTVTQFDVEPIINTVTATVADGEGDTQSDTDSHSMAIVYEPILQVVKTGLATAAVDQVVTYDFEVSHTAASDGSPVSGVTVVDNVAGTATLISGDDGDGLLEGGEVWLYQATYTVQASDPTPLTNTVTVNGTDLDTDPITATDSHDTTVEYDPVLAIDKTGPATANVGDPVTYDFDVYHGAESDGSPISAVSVSDDVAGAAVYVSGDDGDGLLQSTETWIFQATYIIQPTDPNTLTNTATASGTDGNGDPVTAQDSHSTDVEMAPTLSVVKSGPATAVVGDVVTYTMAVSHDTDSDLSPVALLTASDDVAGSTGFVSGDDNGNNLLDGAETWLFSVTYTISASDPDPLINTATASGVDGDGDQVTGSGQHTTNIVFDPVLAITKSGPATADYGDTVTYNFTVRHDPAGDLSPVSGVTVSDDVAGAATYIDGDTDGDGFLEAGETWNYSVTHTIDGDEPDVLTNTATVSATDGDGDTITDTDTHDTAISFAPVLTVTKDGPATAEVGDAVTYTFAVTHHATSDGSPVSGVSVIDDVAGTATYVDGDTDGDDRLDDGETWNYSVTYTVAATDPDPLVNEVSVTGTDGDGTSTTPATDTHSTDIDFLPILEVAKSGPAVSPVGDTVTYTFSVSHAIGSDGSAVSSVTVTDDVAGTATYVSGDDGDNVLEAGETWVFEADYTVLVTDPDPLVNTATVAGTDRDGEAAPTATDTHSTDIDFQPVLDVVKSGPAVSPVGDTVTYTFSVSHAIGSDGSAVSSVTVTDDVAGTATYVSGDDGDGELDSGETWVFEADYTVLVTDPDPLVNTVSVDATDADGEAAATATDTHSTDIDFQPALDVVKSGPTTAVVGETVTYSFSVSHAASSDGSPVSGVTVVDDVAGAATYLSGDDGDNVLEAGETWVFEVDYTVLVTDPDPLVNTVSVDGTDADGEAAPTATDSHSTDIDLAPTITIDTTGPTVAVEGETITYTYTVTHGAGSDGSPIGNVTITDDLADPAVYVSGDTDGDGFLDPDETWIFEADYTVLATDPDPLVNNGTVTGTDGDGDPVTDTDPHTVDMVRAILDIAKSGPASASVGDTVTYTFEVSHDLTSDGSAVANLSVADNVAGGATYIDGDTDGDDLLDGGETWTYEVTYTIEPTDPDPLINTATVLGEDLAGRTLTDTDTHSTDLGFAPVLEIIKSGPAAAADGDTVTYTFGVAHHPTDSDGSAVSTVTVTDDIAGAAAYVSGDDGDGVLEAGETWVFDADYTIQATDPDPLVNIATVTGTDRDGNPIPADTDTHSTDLVRGGLEVVKITTTPYLHSGQTAEFTVVATNNGDSTLTNVTITDPSAPGCATTVATLDVGDSVTITCSVTNVTASFTNTVDATATDTLGNTVTDSDSVDVTVIAPAVTIDITPSAQSVVETGTATYTITVTNTGDSTLNALTVEALNEAGCETDIATLAPSESHIYTCTTTNITTDLTNPVTVTGTDLSGATVTDSDSASVTVLVPAIDIQKTPDIQQVLGDGTATFTITVTNAGATDLTNVTVSDPLAPNCDATFATLAIGAVETYTCTLSPVTADFVNTASVSGDDALGNPHTASDTAEVDVIAPSVAVSKTPDVQTVTTGGTAEFTITVINDGDVPLTDITVTDAAVPACDFSVATLDPGDVATNTCVYGPITGDFTNTVDVVATDPLSGTVTDTDTADVTALIASVSITKNPATQDVAYGGTAEFTITVTNDGEAPLSDITVTDPEAPGCNTTIASLNTGEAHTYTCTDSDVVAGYTNTATVNAVDPAGLTQTALDTAEVTVDNPVLTLAKDPDLTTVADGDPTTFTLTVTNTSAVTLTNVTVTDPLAPACDTVIPSMAPGAVETITCTVASVTDGFTNTATVTADDPYGETHTVTDEAVVVVVHPEIGLAKTADTPVIHEGDTATFTIVVSNLGDVVLSDVTVTDPAAPNCDATFASLAAGESQTYTCTLASVTADFTNIATVTSTDTLGLPRAAADSATVDVITPDITVSVTPASQSVVEHDDAIVEVVITNSGDTTLTDVIATLPAQLVCDPAAPAAGSPATLDPGQSITLTCTVADVTTALTGTVSAEGTDELGLTVTDSDDYAIGVLVPGIEIQKSPDYQLVEYVTDFDITIMVTNTGQTELTTVTVTDPTLTACDNVIGTLAVGESVTYTCSGETSGALSTDFVNTATVTAADPIGNPHTDTDTAEVDVFQPELKVIKSPSTQAVIVDGAATFTIEVANLGDIALTDVVVTDPTLPGCDATFAILDPATSETWSCTVTGVTAGFTNTINATANPPVGEPVTSTDSADVTILTPDVTVDKTPVEPVILQGELAAFSITVTNAGQTDLTDLVVTDPTVPGCDMTIASLTVGEVFSYLCQTDPVVADVNNTITVTATDPLGNPWTATDTATVVVNDAGALTGHLFIDSNGDGVQDVGEPDLAGVDVIITAANGDEIIVTTDTDGNWAAPIVAAGPATVTVDATDPDYPVDHGVSTTTVGGDPNETQTATVVAQETTPTDPVGYAPWPTISGLTWHEMTGDDTYDPGATPADTVLEGTTVELVAPDGTVVDTTTTAPDGTYTLGPVPPGDYTVLFTPPVNLAGDPYDPANPVDGPYDPATPTSVDVTVSLSNDGEVDAGFHLPATIDGVVWGDTDGDGVRTADELGSPGVTVDLVAPDGTVVDTVITADDGTYTFDGVPPGDYTVVVHTDPDFVTAGSHEHPVTITSGDTVGPLETGTTMPITIEGTLWIDLDLDGTIDPGEPPVPGVTLEILDGSGTLVDTVITDADGYYQITDLPPGDYTVTVVDRPGGIINRYETDGTLDETAGFTLPAGGVGHHDIAYEGTASLDQTLWFDFDRDGLIGENEPRLDGAVVEVTWAGFDGVPGTDDDAVFRVVAGACELDMTPTAALTANQVEESANKPGLSARVTAAGCGPGQIRIDGLAPGSYTLDVLEETIPAEYRIDVDPDGVIDGTIGVILTSGESAGDLDMGYIGSAVLGDQVWYDSDGDGEVDPGEPILADVGVLVTWHGLDGLAGTDDDLTLVTRTGADGRYRVEGMPPGEYSVQLVPEEAPAGYNNPPVILTLGAVEVNLSGDIPLPSSTVPTDPLAFTGSSSMRMLWLGLILVVGGAALVALNRETRDLT